MNMKTRIDLKELNECNNEEQVVKAIIDAWLSHLKGEGRKIGVGELLFIADHVAKYLEVAHDYELTDDELTILSIRYVKSNLF